MKGLAEAEVEAMEGGRSPSEWKKMDSDRAGELVPGDSGQRGWRVASGEILEV